MKSKSTRLNAIPLYKNSLIIICFLFFISCESTQEAHSKTRIQINKELTAKDILGNPEYLAISYGGYRGKDRTIQPTLEELKEDMKILSAIGVKILRTYNTKLAQAHNLLKAISQLKKADPNFEMYVMLGAWINCENAWTGNPNHYGEDKAENTAEIQRAVDMANEFPDIVKVIAVGNEAMVKWAADYHVQPGIILNWVNHLQSLKKSEKLPENLWVTSSDNFAAWGGGGNEYHTADLKRLIGAVDYISMHTYPMHETHYDPHFWGVRENERALTKKEKIDAAMSRAQMYAKNQYQNVSDYVASLGIEKPIHIGETGWATASNGFYGGNGTRATDEYKEGMYYKLIREWTNREGISCFYFEAFDEIWKDEKNPGGSENHFGLFAIDGQAKFGLWELVDKGVFNGLSRDENSITKTYGGNLDALLGAVLVPPTEKEIADKK